MDAHLQRVSIRLLAKPVEAGRARGYERRGFTPTRLRVFQHVVDRFTRAHAIVVIRGIAPD